MKNFELCRQRSHRKYHRVEKCAKESEQKLAKRILQSRRMRIPMPLSSIFVPFDRLIPVSDAESTLLAITAPIFAMRSWQLSCPHSRSFSRLIEFSQGPLSEIDSQSGVVTSS